MADALRLHGKRHRIACPPIAARSAGLGYVPQEREIFPSLTVRENLEVGGPARPLDDRARCSSCFRKLAARQTNRGNQLSGGEQQMLAIGRALVATRRCC